MAVPGFSVSDLIQALGQVKIVYDAFFNEYTSSASQLRDLADDIEQFRRNLKKHQEIVEARGLEFSGYEAVQRTLDQCRKFLGEYKEVLDKRRRKSVVGAFKTARLPYEHHEIDRLRGQIARHESNILHFSMNIVLEHSFRGGDKDAPTTPGFELSISNPSSAPTLPSELLGGPLTRNRSSTLGAELCGNEQRESWFELPAPPVSENAFSSGPFSAPAELYVGQQSPPLRGELPAPSLTGGTSRHRSSVYPELHGDTKFPPCFELPDSPNPENTVMIGRNYGSASSSSSVIVTPQQMGTSVSPLSPQNSVVIPGLVLPQAALPYRVAEVYFGTKKVDLKRKPIGRNYDGGRELLILDQDGNMRFRHRIKLPRGELCYPYTWHRRWHKDHAALEIGFKGGPSETHSVSFKGMTPINAIPKYIFTNEEDFQDFQGEVRGKHLEDTFNIRQITSAISSKNGEATDQHLKIWRDHESHEYAISFYASVAVKPRNVEVPLAMFDQDIVPKGATDIRLNFVTIETKLGRTFSKTFSRSPTDRSSSSSTTTPGIFSRTNTGIGSVASSVTTAPSRTSIASFESEDGQPRRRYSKPEQSIESQAKHMKYLKIEFSDDAEATRFKQTYDSLYKEEISRPLDFFLNWQMNAGQQRPDSILSSSPNGTPYTMSPELHPRSPVFYEDER